MSIQEKIALPWSSRKDIGMFAEIGLSLISELVGELPSEKEEQRLIKENYKKRSAPKFAR